MPAPVITQQPQDAVGFAYRVGAKFSCDATGDLPLGFQWYWADGDELIPGATAKDLLFDKVPFNKAGKDVYCIVTDVNTLTTQTDNATIIQVVNPDIGMINPEMADYAVSPWTQVNTGFSWRNSSAYNLWHHRGQFAGGTSDSFAEAYQDVPIDLNEDLLLATWAARGFADNDQARSYYQFVDGTGTLIGSRVQWSTDVPTNQDATKYSELLIPATSIPANAASIRMTTIYDRNSGTSNNVSLVYHAVISDPDNYVDAEGLNGVDTLWQYVYALLRMDGTDGDTTVVNSGLDPSTWTFEGTGELSDAQTIFGNATSARFNGDGALVSTDTSHWPGSYDGDVNASLSKSTTVEMWFWPDVGSTGTEQRGLWYVGRTDNNDNRVQVQILANGTVQLFHDVDTQGVTVLTTTNTVNEGQWNYVRCSYGNPATLQLNDGDPITYRFTGLTNASYRQPLYDGLRIGFARGGSAERYFLGYIGPVRFTGAFRSPRKTIAPITNFPTVEIDPIYDDLVISHIIGDEANGSTTIVDNKGVSWTPTNVAYTSAAQKFGINSLRFTNGYLETSDFPDFDLGNSASGYLHFSAWVNWDGVSLTPLFFMGAPGTTGGRLQSRINADGSLQLFAEETDGTDVMNNEQGTVALAGAGWHYIEVKFTARRGFMTANSGFVNNPVQSSGVAVSYNTPTVFRLGYSQAGAVGQNATCEMVDVRITYGPSGVDTAGRSWYTDSGRAVAPLKLQPTISEVPTDGPTITTQPQSQSVEDQQNAVFTVVATSSGGPLTYQWYRDGDILLPGETTDTLTVLADWDTNQGEVYYCDVSDDNGTVRTNLATLTVTQVPLVITVQPQNQTVDDLTNATFTVTVTGRGPFTYQWYEEAVAMPGETTDTLVVPADFFVNDGFEYYCIIGDYYEP